MQQDHSPVLFEQEGSVAYLTLNRPAQGNAMNMDLVASLLREVVRCETSKDVRCVVLCANGKLFCAGGDVSAMMEAGENRAAYLAQLAGTLHLSISRLAKLSKPVIVEVNGPAAGAGFPLAMAGDVVFASEKASFQTAYAGIGLTADGSSTWTLPRLVGQRKAQELLLLNERVSAADALEMGLVTRVIAEDELSSKVRAAAERMAAGPVNALGGIKSLLTRSFESSLESQMEEELRLMVKAGSSPESIEGIAAFMEKRAPDFSAV